MTSGILIGFAVGLGVVALAALLYLLYRLSGQIDEIGRQVEELLEVNCETQKILQKLADQTTTLRGLINAFGRSVAAMEQTTQAIRGLSGLLIAPGTGEAGGDLGTGAVETLWQRGAPPRPAL